MIFRSNKLKIKETFLIGCIYLSKTSVVMLYCGDETNCGPVNICNWEKSCLDENKHITIIAPSVCNLKRLHSLNIVVNKLQQVAGVFMLTFINDLNNTEHPISILIG